MPLVNTMPAARETCLRKGKRGEFPGVVALARKKAKNTPVEMTTETKRLTNPFCSGEVSDGAGNSAMQVTMKINAAKVSKPLIHKRERDESRRPKRTAMESRTIMAAEVSTLS